MTVVEVGEWSSVTAMLDAETERALRRAAGGRLTIAPADGGGVRIAADRRHVGVIAAPGVTVIVQPKLEVASLLHLLESDGRPLSVDPDTAALSDRDELTSAFATLYRARLERLVRSGLRRGYRTVSEPLGAVRGRIDVAAQSRRAGPYPLQCEYDDYVLDTTLNRRALAAAQRLLHLPGVAGATRRGLARLAADFVEVGPLRPADLVRPVIGRMDAEYVSVDRLAEMCLAGSSAQLAAGRAPIPSFTVNLEQVVQKFVTAGLRRRLTGILSVHGEPSQYLDDARQVRIEPDLLFGDEQHPLYVADVKYKGTVRQGGLYGFARDDDYYQLLAYVATNDLPEGMLIHIDEQPPREITVRRVGARLVSYSLSLANSIDEIERRMDRLADEITRRAFHANSSASA